MADYSSIKPVSKEAKSEEEKHEVKKVVTGGVATKKKGSLSKLSGQIISEDAKGVKDYVFMDVLIPAIKKAISDIVTNGIDIILYGEAGHTKKKTAGNYVSYNSYSKSDSRPRARVSEAWDLDDIIFESRGDAEMVADQMGELIDRYGYVTVADLYDMAGITAPYTANKYGWMSVKYIEVIRARGGGYSIKLPRPMAID